MKIFAFVCLAAVAGAIAGGHARAADPPKAANPRAEAKRLYDEGTKHYNLAEYPQAIEKYRAAYALVPEPTLLFNIAQSYRLAGDFRMARTFYKNYQNNAPNAVNRKLVDEKIAEMNDLLAKQERAATGPPTSTMEPDKIEKTPPAEHPTATATPPTATTEPAATPTPTTTTTAEPQPATAAATTTQKPAASADKPTPLYKKWWLWTIVGGVVVVGVAVGVGAGVAASSSSAVSAPASDFGNTRIFGLEVRR